MQLRVRVAGGQGDGVRQRGVEQGVDLCQARRHVDCRREVRYLRRAQLRGTHHIRFLEICNNS